MPNLSLTYPQLYELQVFINHMDKNPSDLKNIASIIKENARRESFLWIYNHKKEEPNEKKAKIFSYERKPTITKEDLANLDLPTETAALYEETKALKVDSMSLDVRESLAISKLQLELLDKILNLHDKSKRNKQIGEFVKYVFTILTEEQKKQVLDTFEGTYSE